MYFSVIFLEDPSWGVNKFGQSPRQQAAKFTLKYYEYDPSRLKSKRRLSQITAYDRCKANRRCNWGIVGKKLCSMYQHCIAIPQVRSSNALSILLNPFVRSILYD